MFSMVQTSQLASKVKGSLASKCFCTFIIEWNSYIKHIEPNILKPKSTLLIISFFFLSKWLSCSLLSNINKVFLQSALNKKFACHFICHPSTLCSIIKQPVVKPWESRCLPSLLAGLPAIVSLTQTMPLIAVII